MNVFNVFRLNSMPTGDQEQNAVVEKLFTVRNMHIHDDEGYFLVRCTSINPVGEVTAAKLDPSRDAKLMGELVNIFLENEGKLA